MNEQRLETLVRVLREAIILFLGGLEDYLGIAYDRSALAKRREKIKG